MVHKVITATVNTVLNTFNIKYPFYTVVKHLFITAIIKTYLLLGLLILFNYIYDVHLILRLTVYNYIFLNRSWTILRVWKTYDYVEALICIVESFETVIAYYNNAFVKKEIMPMLFKRNTTIFQTVSFSIMHLSCNPSWVNI